MASILEAISETEWAEQAADAQAIVDSLSIAPSNDDLDAFLLPLTRRRVPLWEVYARLWAVDQSTRVNWVVGEIVNYFARHPSVEIAALARRIKAQYQ